MIIVNRCEEQLYRYDVHPFQGESIKTTISVRADINWRDGKTYRDAEINWPALGAVDPRTANEFAKGLSAASRLAESIQAAIDKGENPKLFGIHALVHEYLREQGRQRLRPDLSTLCRNLKMEESRLKPILDDLIRMECIEMSTEDSDFYVTYFDPHKDSLFGGGYDQLRGRVVMFGE